MGGNDVELAGTLATMAANQQAAADALVRLTDTIEQSREEAHAHAMGTQSRLGDISTELATTQTTLANHIATDDERIDLLWRVLKWAGGVGAFGGAAMGGVKIASAAFF